MTKRVVITGIGLITPAGSHPQAFWEDTCAGRSHIAGDPEMAALGLQSQVNSRISTFEIASQGDAQAASDLAQHDRFVQLGYAASRQALLAAGFQPGDARLTKAGFVFASAIGGTPTIQQVYEQSTAQGRGPLRYVPTGPYFYESGCYNFTAAYVAQRFGLGGEVVSLSTGCTAGLDALGEAYQRILAGEAKIMLAGASEAPLCSLTYATLDIISSLSKYAGDPSRASRPFDKERSGFVISEGAVTLVLEEASHAQQRGATIFGEVLGFDSSNNAHHMTNLPADGEPLYRLLARLFQATPCTPEDIDYINAHGSSTPQNDVFETTAFKKLFGPRAYEIPISSSKSLLGHSLSSASLTGTVAALGALYMGRIHPTINVDETDERCDLDYVTEGARMGTYKHALVTASGFGGIHSACVLREAEQL